ncbi:MAG: TetR/AcrR family transcriptional regulator [Mariprofundales bacterium]|nr:TetR/AcrR family transcriptional regulator [Mariprofundales bacterium]
MVALSTTNPTASDKILDAAQLRFADYGPCKTTMTEIAADCDMSVGNLYRHFKNKDAIAVACLERQMQQKLDAGVQAAIAEHDPLAALRAFLLTRLRIGHAQFSGTRHLFELLTSIELRHRAVLLKYEAKVIDALTTILNLGVAQGCFATLDSAQTAYDIHQGTLRYNNPITLKNNDLSILEQDLNRLVDLLYRGLECN